MCQHAEEHSHPESVHDISGSVLRLRGDESPPLAGTRGSHFVFPVPFQARQLCSFERISEAAGTHGVGFSGMSSGLITHAPATAMAEISSPLDETRTSGRLRNAVTRGCIEALTPWRNPDLFSRGVPLDTVASGVVLTTDASTRSWGAVCEGMPALGLWSEPQSQGTHKPLGAGSSLLSSKGVRTQIEQQHVLICTNNTSVVSYLYHQGGIRSRALCKQATNLLLWADGRLVSIRAAHIPGLRNRGADMLSRKGIPQGEWSLYPESVRMIWNRYGRAEVDLFATSDNAHCPLFFSLSHSPLEGDALISR